MSCRARRVRTDSVRTAPRPLGGRWPIDARLALRVQQARDVRVAGVSGLAGAGRVNGTRKIRTYPSKLKRPRIAGPRALLASDGSPAPAIRNTMDSNISAIPAIANWPRKAPRAYKIRDRAPSSDPMTNAAKAITPRMLQALATMGPLATNVRPDSGRTGAALLHAAVYTRRSPAIKSRRRSSGGTA